MKKQYWYVILVIFFATTVSFVVLKYKNQQQEDNNTVYTLLPRKANDQNKAEWIAAKANTEKLIKKLQAAPSDTKAAIALVNAYIMESRASGNVAYYDKASMKVIDQILKAAPENLEALGLKSLVQLSQHHFSDGLETAQKAVSLDSNSAFIYGLLVDANVEMGNYREAVDAAEKMITVRPDLRSYSRIAYIREIYGDYPGAIDAMNMAVQSGIPGEESTEWCRAQLGKIFEYAGNRQAAIFQYQLSLAARPGYAYALAGMGRVAADEKKYDSAVYYFEQASLVVNDLGVKQGLATAYKNSGNQKKADKLNEEVIDEMNANAQTAANDPTAGHYSDKELAYAYLQVNNNDKALEHALAEFNRRPKNIDVNETMAWVYFKRNELSKALPYLETAMATHSRNPLLLSTAGLIYAGLGDVEKATLILQAVLKHNPVIPGDIKDRCAVTLKNI